MRLWLALLALAGCAPEGTRVRLAVRYDAAWALDGVQVTMAQHPDADARMAHELLLLVPDSWAGGSIGIDLWGVHKSERRAWGHAEVTPVKNGEVKKEVVLTRLPCGEWCTRGAVECSGSGTVACIADADGCTDWGPPTTCPSPSPFCAFGACADTCRDECAAGESRCDGASGVRTCGHISDDTCLHWLSAVACMSGQVCSNGACAATCSDECTAGAVSCLEGGVITCGDLNHDGCQEWSPIVPCTAGTCSGGTCSTTCSDDCTTSECSGLVYRACGKFSADNCNHLSAGVSCVPTDPCQAGRCGAGGCESAPLVCEAPPASICTDANTLRVYDPSGTCSAGTCGYGSHDVACLNCPACDPSPSPSCAPACTGKSCGADDGCGGKCLHGCWMTAASMSTAREGTAAATALDGRIFVIGGNTSGLTGDDLTLVEELTPGAPGTPGTWRTVAPLPLARSFIGAATAPDGRIYVAGGYGTGDTSAVFIYTPGAPGSPGSWASGPSLGVSPNGPGVATGSDGRIYVAGGYGAAAESLGSADTAWTPLADMIEAREYTCAASVGDGRIYSFVGITLDSNGPSEAYTIATGKWASIASTGSNRDGVGCAASSADGRIYLIGGSSEDSGGHVSYLVKVQAYTPSTDQWAPVTSLPSPRENLSAAAALDGRVYAFGGSANGKNPLSSVVYYTP